MTGGRPSSSTVRMRCGIARATSEIRPRWRKMLMRKRATPAISCEMSMSLSRRNSSWRLEAVSSAFAAASVSASVITAQSSLVSGPSSPSTRASGTEPDLEMEVGAVAGDERAENLFDIEQH